MLQVTIHDEMGAVVYKSMLLPEPRLALLVDYLKAVKQDDFSGTWGPAEVELFKNFSDAIPKDGT